MEVPASVDLLGGLDAESVAANNRCKYKIAYLTVGNPSDPCVIVPPGGGATKEENLFWTRELARIGHFFVVMYDMRGTGASEPLGRWSDLFSKSGTTACSEMERVFGAPKKEDTDTSDGSGGVHCIIPKGQPAPLNPAISNGLHDYDGCVEDAFWVMDELKIEKAHFVGLSQGGALARMCAMRYPERTLSCVSCCSSTDKLGIMMAGMSEGAEEYYDQIKKANLFTKDGKVPFDKDTVTKEQYVAWRSKFVSIIAPGFNEEVYTEMAAMSFDAGFVSESDGAICALAYEATERQGKIKKHLEDLKQNKKVPIMYVHGRRDPVVHFGEIQKLFAVTGNCVMETHEYGHNLGPPSHQTKLLGKMALFMKKNTARSALSEGVDGPQVGRDAFAGGVSLEVKAKFTPDSKASDLWEGFLSVQTAADTSFVLDILLGKFELTHLRGQGLKLFLALKPALEKAGLQFRQKKLLTDLHASLLRAHKVVARVRGKAPEAVNEVMQESVSKAENQQFAFNDILVCGAGPVGLRTACELALLGFCVTVIEKRPNFSRANILTFWDETMNDMLALGAKSYFPSLQPTGTQKILGTRQIQVCLLKTLLLFGGTVRYGTEICGLRPPASSGSKWLATFRPYVKHRRAAVANADAKQSAAQEGAEAPPPEEATKDATDFQKAKDYGGKEIATVESWDIDQAFLNSADVAEQEPRDACPDYDGRPVPFDAYVIAEGGWSDSTRKLGFSKAVDTFKPAFGLVANLVYDQNDLKEKNMMSQIHFVLGKTWPLSNCPIQAEFVEYLKGETHFFALVVSKRNNWLDRTDSYLEKMKPEDRAALPDEVIEQMRRASKQKGLLEMGVFRQSFSSGRACLANDNVDMVKLTEMVRDITQEMGLPATTKFYPANPVQLFDFSRRARCIEPVRVLRGSSSGAAPAVLSPSQQLAAPSTGENIDALVFPVGDALQEPIWTQGLGINRGFHTGMNQAYACLLAREKGATAAVQESVKIHEATCKMKWGMGHSGLAGSGSGSIGLKPFKQWDTDPRNRLPIK